VHYIVDYAQLLFLEEPI